MSTEEIWFADSIVSGRRFGVVLAARLAQDYQIDILSDMGYDQTDVLVGVESNTTYNLYSGLSADTHILKLKQAASPFDFKIINLSPREANGWAVLGEVNDKWVGVSPARFQSISSDDFGLDVVLRGTPGEKVTVNFVLPSDEIVSVTCEVDDASTARIHTSGVSLVCY